MKSAEKVTGRRKAGNTTATGDRGHPNVLGYDFMVSNSAGALPHRATNSWSK